jgi:hypothetical protein
VNRSTPYSRIVEKIDLSAAMTAVKRNDLLPPRPDDKVGGQVGERFVAALKHSLSTGDYEPEHAIIIPVTKPKFSTRPAALMNLADRIVFHALVDPLRPRIERGLVSDQVLYWPRATKEVEKRWRDFETAAIHASGDYIVRADVTGFYESIDHQLLQQILVKLTGMVELVDVLIDFLGQVMNAPRGLPQGLDTCDVLASAYLNEVDSEMLRTVDHYWRNGDDVRMTVSNYDAGRRAVHLLEKQLRSVRLLLNADKTRVLLRKTYEDQMEAVEQRRKETQRKILIERESRLADAEYDDVSELIEKAGIDEETQFELFYHRTISLQDLADELRPHLEPSQVEVAVATFEEALARAPGESVPEPLSDEEFHGIVASSLTVLLADKHQLPISAAPGLVRRFPDKTELVCAYLRGVTSSYPAEVAAAATESLTSGYLLGWQQAWLFTVLRSVAASAPDTEIDAGVHAAVEVASDEEASWLARAEAARLLAQVGKLRHELVIKLWNRGPVAIQADLTAAVAVMADGETAWAEAFRDSLNSDALMQVVLSGVAAAKSS